MHDEVDAGNGLSGKGTHSRQDIEELCLIDAVGRCGCHPDELTSKLGLSPSLKSAVETATRTLETQDLINLSENLISLTEKGLARLAKIAGEQS